MIGKFAFAIRDRWLVLMIIVLGMCVPVYATAWWFDVINNVAANITITGIVSAMPIIHLFSPSERLTCTSLIVWYSVFLWLASVGFVGEEYGLRFLSFSTILILAALPGIYILVETVRRERILIAGFASALIAIMVYWFAGLTSNDESYDLLLVPLPVVSIGGAIWAPVALVALQIARRHKNRRISGPGTQALAMTTLFLPVFIVALTIPTDLGLSATWSNVSLALIGLFLSGAISEPLRRMLIEWGNLAPCQN